MGCLEPKQTEVQATRNGRWTGAAAVSSQPVIERPRRRLPRSRDPETSPVGVPKPLAHDRIEAAKNVVMMDLVLLSAEIANGMHKKSVDQVVKEYRFDPLPPELREVIVAA